MYKSFFVLSTWTWLLNPHNEVLYKKTDWYFTWLRKLLQNDLSTRSYAFPHHNCFVYKCWGTNPFSGIKELVFPALDGTQARSKLRGNSNGDQMVGFCIDEGFLSYSSHAGRQRRANFQTKKHLNPIFKEKNNINSYKSMINPPAL